MMKLYFVFAAITFAVAPFAIASDDDPQQVLKAALEQERFLQSASLPYALDAEITAQMNGPIQGHFRFRWQSPDHWWSRVDLGPFQQIEIRNGEMEYTARNSEFTLLRVSELFGLLHLENDVERLPMTSVKKKARTDSGRTLACVQGRDPRAPTVSREICVDETSRELVSDVAEFSSADKQVELFSNYTEFKGAHFPGRLVQKRGDQPIISVNITGLKPMPFDPALFEIPNGAIVRRKCPGLEFPKLLAPTTINFGLDRPDSGTEATLSLTVLPDGTASDIHLIGSGGEILDRASISGVKHWKFKPAMCGKDPIAYDTRIQISF